MHIISTCQEIVVSLQRISKKSKRKHPSLFKILPEICGGIASIVCTLRIALNEPGEELDTIDLVGEHGLATGLEEGGRCRKRLQHATPTATSRLYS